MATQKNLFEDALRAEGVIGKLAAVARSIYMQESGGGKNTTTSNAGAVGGMQIIKPTFDSVADKGWDIANPEHNARAGIRYLRQLDKQSGGDPALTAAGYYGGPGGMEKARKGIAVYDPRNPKAPSTLEYGQQVAARIKGPQSPYYLDQPDAAFANAAAPPVSAVAQKIAAVAAQPQAASIPIPVPVLQEAQQVAVQAPVQEPDPWAAFQVQQRQAAPVQVAELGFGQPVPINVPDFMAAVGKAPEQQVAWGAPAKTGSKYSALIRSLIG